MDGMIGKKYIECMQLLIREQFYADKSILKSINAMKSINEFEYRFIFNFNSPVSKFVSVSI